MTPPQQLTYPDDRDAERLDSFLAERFPDLSRSQIKKLIDSQQVLLDGTATKASQKLKGGELIEIDIPEPEPTEALPEDIPLTILYEDHDLIVVDKAPGMVVHPAAGHAHGTLVNALLHHCDDLAGIGGELRPGIVHRIDKDTSGVLVATKNDQSHQHLAAQFKAHTVKRRYLALICGQPQHNSGTIDQPVGRHQQHRKKMSSNTRHGKRAVTHWQVLQRFPSDGLSLVECRLETGRTHQIRVHLSEMNLPLAGDPLYGGLSRLKNLSDTKLRALLQQLPGQALHARVLGFEHPNSGKYMEFSSELPQAFAAVVDYLEKKYADPAQPVR
ncbi:ribosomal large subunit pseudouridine synthase D [Malonomonas rubra DSM 5091]|uniref:Pseudouridine synthase n=1 Tax=Malonomonas rubra DSM 5091 TaxID=1122189 RepID=A0A1M6F672_MALRU|nr:RluA family pseudouridine synthase [Malonomonas rubra]SHI93163.1 ribosomal large subunit pseudouridine synthase D [Malonomonas rubra DSM 5091]